MAKNASRSVSKNGDRYNNSNISPGGQIYDRTTGTWVGENQGNVGGGYTGDGVGRGSLVIHDANGPVGVKLAPVKRHTSDVSLPQGPGAGLTSNGVNKTGSSSPGASVSGPGAPAAATKGGLGLFAAPRGVSPNGGVLKTKLKDENTSLMVGGIFIEAPPGFSNADQWEELMGEPGDWLGGIVVGAGTAYHNLVHRPVSFLSNPANSPNLKTQDYAGKGNHYLQSVANWWEQANSPWGPDKPTWGYSSGGF